MPRVSQKYSGSGEKNPFGPPGQQRPDRRWSPPASRMGAPTSTGGRN